jgi:putative membrane protein
MSFVASCEKGLACLAVCCLTASVGVLAQAPASAPSQGLSSMDLKFVRNAVADGVAEVELGRLAQQKGSSGQIKDFGARIEQDHIRLNDELRAIAAAKGAPLPTGLSKDRLTMLEQMSKLEGAAFDNAFSQHMLVGHQSAVSSFDKQALAAGDADLRALAARSLPTLRDHLTAARGLGNNATLGK